MPTTDKDSSKTSPMKILMMVLVFAAAFVVLQWVVGIAFSIMKWVAIGGLALLVTYVLFSKSKGGKSKA